MGKPEKIHEWRGGNGSDGKTRYRLSHNGREDREEAVVLEQHVGQDALGAEQWRPLRTVRVGWYANKDRDTKAAEEATKGGEPSEDTLSEILAAELAHFVRSSRPSKMGVP